MRSSSLLSSQAGRWSVCFGNAVHAQRRWASHPPAWASVRSRQPRPRHGRKGYRSGRPVSRNRDAVGMLIPEVQLQSTHVSYSRFDASIENAARHILALDVEDEEREEHSTATSNYTVTSSSTVGETSTLLDRRPVKEESGISAAHSLPAMSFGAAFDSRLIRFQGRGGDARVLAEQAARLEARRAAERSSIAGRAADDGSALSVEDEKGVTEDGTAPPVSAFSPAHERPSTSPQTTRNAEENVLRSHPTRFYPALDPRQYLTGSAFKSGAPLTATTTTPSSSSPSAATPNAFVELDDGEKVSVKTTGESSAAAVLRRITRQRDPKRADSEASESRKGEDQDSANRSTALPWYLHRPVDTAVVDVAPKGGTAKGKQRVRAEQRRRSSEKQFQQMGVQAHPCRVQGGGCATVGGLPVEWRSSSSAAADLRRRGAAPRAAFSGYVKSHYDTNGGGGHCGLAGLPSVSCLALHTAHTQSSSSSSSLSDVAGGGCALRSLCCCPWHHGDWSRQRVATMETEVLFASDTDPITLSARALHGNASSSFADGAASKERWKEEEEEDEESAAAMGEAGSRAGKLHPRRLRRGAESVGQLLQLVTDLVVAAVEDAEDGADREAFLHSAVSYSLSSSSSSACSATTACEASAQETLQRILRAQQECRHGAHDTSDVSRVARLTCEPVFRAEPDEPSTATAEGPNLPPREAQSEASSWWVLSMDAPLALSVLTSSNQSLPLPPTTSVPSNGAAASDVREDDPLPFPTWLSGHNVIPNREEAVHTDGNRKDEHIRATQRSPSLRSADHVQSAADEFEALWREAEAEEVAQQADAAAHSEHNESTLSLSFLEEKRAATVASEDCAYAEGASSQRRGASAASALLPSKGVLHDLEHIWGSYVSFVSDSAAPSADGAALAHADEGNHIGGGTGRRLVFSPLLTRWVLWTAACQLQCAPPNSPPSARNDDSNDSDTVQAGDRAGQEEHEEMSVQSPYALFVSASTALLQQRWAACEAYRARHTEEAPETSRAVERWAPLLLLKDSLLLRRLPPTPSRAMEDDDEDDDDGGQWADLTRADSLEPNDAVYIGLYGANNEVPAPTAAGAAGSDSATTCSSADSLFSLILLQMSNTDLGAAVTERERSRIESRVTTQGVRGRAAVSRELERAWDTAHVFLAKLTTALLQLADARHTEGRLFAFVQSSLLNLGQHLSVVLGERYEEPLLTSVGWSPWSEQHIFTEAHSALYSPTGYARHHMPVVAPAAFNSLVNTLLQCTLSYSDDRFGLAQRSTVHTLFPPPTASALPSPPAELAHKDSAKGGDDALTRVQVQQRAYLWADQRHRQQPRHLPRLLRPYLHCALTFLSTLQDLSMHVLATREALLRQFAALRSQAVADQDDDVSHHTRASRHTGTRERSGGSGSGGSEHARRVRERLEAVQRVPLMDSLLPCGSVLVSAPAVAHLIRQLSESGHHYRALKLSAAIVRASRLLRRAARLPAPHVVKQERVVYRHVRSRKTQRKVVVKERVPVFRVVGGVSTMDVDGSGGGGGDAHAWGEEALAALALGGEQSVAHAASSAVKPVGMLYQVEGAVVEEMVRVGLRMGAAGWKLADGVRDECFQGAVVDYTTGRGLPVPSEEQVAQFVRQPLSASSGVDASLVVVVGGVAHALLELVGLAQRHGRRQGGGLLPAPPLGANNEQALQPVRVPPSPLLLEIAQTHTDSSDVDRHRRYRAEFLQDAGRFSTLGNLIAMQFSTMLRNPLHAVQAMHCVWVAATATVLSTPSRGTVRGTGAGGGGTQGVEWLDARPFISLPGAEPTFTSLSVSASPSTLSALAEMRWLDQTRRQLQREVEADRGTVRALVSLTADEEGDEDYNRGATLASSPRTLSEVKSFLSGSQRDGGLTEGTSPSSVTGTSSSRSRRGGGRERSSTTSRDVMARRHEALVYHCWFSPTAASSSLRQQRERLWGLCAATLLGLSPDVGFGTHHVAQWSTAVLRNTIAAAAGVVLTPTPSARDEAAPSFDAAGTLTPQQRVLLHNTVRALLLSPFFSSTPTLRRDGDAEGERWRVLSSGYTPAVHSVHEFLHVQLHLWQELQRAGGAAGDEKDEDDEMVPRASTPVTAMVGRPSAEAVFVRELSAVLHGAAMASTHPAWQLYKRLLQNPVLAHWWLRHTLFDPSPELLLWIASAVPSTDCRREEVDVQSVTAIEGWARQLLTQPSSGTPTQDAAAVEEVAAMMQRALQRVPATRLPQRQRI